MELNEKELYKIDGGAGWGIVAGIAAAVVFVVGFFSGQSRLK